LVGDIVRQCPSGGRGGGWGGDGWFSGL
jgi:hypothetical protein